MKKSVFGRKLGRDKNERTALFKSLMSSLIMEDRIQTTEAKARAIRPQVEKLVTKALKGTNATDKIIASSLNSNAIKRFMTDVAPRFKDRKGGYTRMIKIGSRLGDQSPMVVLEWVEMPKAVAVIDSKAAKSIKEKPVRKAAVKKTVKKPIAKKPAAKKAVRKTK